MRAIHKQWRNGPGGKWKCRITWYEAGRGQDIRLKLETEDGMKHLFPKSVEEANQIWDKFKLDHPKV